MAHDGAIKCVWCKDRPGGCMLCLTPKEAAETSKASENIDVVQRRSDEASRNIAAMPEEPEKVERYYPRSAWDVTDPDE